MMTIPRVFGVLLTALATLALAPGPRGLPAAAFPKADRPVAGIVSPHWSDETTRDRHGEARQIQRVLGIRAGMTVADVGAGAGYHVARLSPVVGPTGRVIGQDVTPRYLRQLSDRVRRAGLKNVTLVQGDVHDPRLPPRSADIVLLVHMYHEVESPYAFLYNLTPALKAGGRVAVVDLDRPTERHGTPPALLRCEFAAVGFRQISLTDLTGDLGYLAVYEPTTRPEPSRIAPCRNRVRR